MFLLVKKVVVIPPVLLMLRVQVGHLIAAPARAHKPRLALYACRSSCRTMYCHFRLSPPHSRDRFDMFPRTVDASIQWHLQAVYIVHLEENTKSITPQTNHVMPYHDVLWLAGCEHIKATVWKRRLL